MPGCAVEVYVYNKRICLNHSRVWKKYNFSKMQLIIALSSLVKSHLWSHYHNPRDTQSKILIHWKSQWKSSISEAMQCFSSYAIYYLICHYLFKFLLIAVFFILSCSFEDPTNARKQHFLLWPRRCCFWCLIMFLSWFQSFCLVSISVLVIFSGVCCVSCSF